VPVSSCHLLLLLQVACCQEAKSGSMQVQAVALAQVARAGEVQWVAHQSLSVRLPAGLPGLVACLYIQVYQQCWWNFCSLTEFLLTCSLPHDVDGSNIWRDLLDCNKSIKQSLLLVLYFMNGRVSLACGTG